MKIDIDVKSGEDVRQSVEPKQPTWYPSTVPRLHDKMGRRDILHGDFSSFDTRPFIW